MAPSRKITTTEATTKDTSISSRNEIKDLAKKVDILTTECKAISGLGLRADEQEKQRNEQAASIDQCREELHALSSTATKHNERLRHLSREVDDGLLATGEGSVGFLKATLNRQPIMIISKEYWDVLYREKESPGSLSDALKERDCVLQSTNENLAQAQGELLSSKDRIRFLEHKFCETKERLTKSEAALESFKQRTRSLKAEFDVAESAVTQNYRLVKGALSDKAEIKKHNDALTEAYNRVQAQNSKLISQSRTWKERVKNLEHRERESQA